LDPDPGSRNGRQFAEFLDNKLTEELAFQGSAGHQRTLRSRQLTEQKIQRIDEDVAKAQKKGTTAAVQKEVKAWGLDMTGYDWMMEGQPWRKQEGFLKRGKESSRGWLRIRG